jgi:hypothetical protein
MSEAGGVILPLAISVAGGVILPLAISEAGGVILPLAISEAGGVILPLAISVAGGVILPLAIRSEGSLGNGNVNEFTLCNVPLLLSFSNILALSCFDILVVVFTEKIAQTNKTYSVFLKVFILTP